MRRIIALVVPLVLCWGASSFAGTVYFTGLGDSSPLVAASGDLSIDKGGFLISGTGKTTNLVTEFAEINPTTVEGMGTLTVILTEPNTSGWMFFKLYTASGGEIQVGIGDNEVDGTISTYITLDEEVNFEVPDSDNAVGYRLASDGSTWSIETTADYGRTWNEGLSWDMTSLPGDLTGDRVIDVIEIGAWAATAGYCQVSWDCDDFDDLNAPNSTCATRETDEDETREDIVIADFEGETYGDWTIEGKAFGSGPSKGTLPDQPAVSGYQGEGLANSFVGGDASTGKLSSPRFKIERDYINFLIGGGAHGPSASIHLELFWQDESWIIRSASGATAEPGGSGFLEWEVWDVSKFKGLEAQIHIVDEVTGGWGHITIDQIVQSNTSSVEKRDAFTQEVEIDHDYLHFPVKTGGLKRLVKLQRDGASLREFTIEFATGEPDFWVYLETHDFRGEELTLVAEQRRGDRGNVLDRVTVGDTPKNSATFYKEKLRPQFHFSSPRGWNNDPNGLVYYKGEYHLFYQRNPFGWAWDNMTWGHAISEDMVHWKHLPDALHPDAMGTMYSGTAIVDKKNTLGFKTGDEDPIILFYTSAGGMNPWSKGEPHTQSMAYSNDRGRTITKYEDNPIVDFIRGGNRDPRVFWHEPTKKWVMVLYLDDSEIGFFTSDNLKDWTEHKQSRIKGFHECPELFEMPVDGDEGNKKWVLYGAAGDYMIGGFNGTAFTPETEIIEYAHGEGFYASQLYSNIPEEDGRVIQMAWGRIDIPGMPFNQMMTFPVSLELRSTGDGIRLCPMPIREIEKLYASEEVFENTKVEPGSNLLSGIEGDLFDIEADIEILEADRVGFRIRGIEITYDVKAKTLTSGWSAYESKENSLMSGESSASLEASEGRIQLRILVDRASIETFANNGEVYMPQDALPEEGQAGTLELFVEGGAAKIKLLSVRELESIW
jgi:fructan beta-fructosidase